MPPAKAERPLVLRISIKARTHFSIIIKKSKYQDPMKVTQELRVGLDQFFFFLLGLFYSSLIQVIIYSSSFLWRWDHATHPRTSHLQLVSSSILPSALTRTPQQFICDDIKSTIFFSKLSQHFHKNLILTTHFMPTVQFREGKKGPRMVQVRLINH